MLCESVGRLVLVLSGFAFAFSVIGIAGVGATLLLFLLPLWFFVPFFPLISPFEWVESD